MTDQWYKFRIDTDLVRKQSGSSTGTGTSQEISHGLGTTWTHLSISYWELESGVTFTSFVAPTAGSLDHFHLTVTNDKDWAWVAESW